MPVRGALILAVVVAAVAAHGATASPPAPAPACHISASAPFLYSVVIPVSVVECDGPARRLRIETQLTRDGVSSGSSWRTCRDTSSCWLTVDASAPDEPGDQLWCTVTSGYAGTTFLGSASACETDEF